MTAGATFSHGAFFHNEADFLLAIKSTYYLEDFHAFDSYDGSSTRSLPSYSGAGNGYSWTATATGLNDPLLDHVYALNPNNNGALSVDSNVDDLVFTFGPSKPVTAFGGYFYNTDTDGSVNGGDVTLHLDGGETVNVASSTAFFGYVGTASILSARISGDANIGGYITADHVYTASATPEPFTMGLGLASAAVFVRRRLKAKRA